MQRERGSESESERERDITIDHRVFLMSTNNNKRDTKSRTNSSLEAL